MNIVHWKLSIAAAAWLVAAVAPDLAIAADPPRRVVIPFDFVSEFDDGRYGQMVGDLIWKRLQRDGHFVIPESMIDVRDTCTSNNLHPSPESTLQWMKKTLREDFGADVAIWGSVERAPGHDLEVYDLVIRCVDFTAGPKPKVVYERKVRTKSVSEIPHLYVKQMLDALHGRKPGATPAPDASAERAWRENPSLLPGDFQQGTGGVPHGWTAAWEAGEVNQREKLGRTVQWIPEVGSPANRVIRFTFAKRIGDTTGVAYYSEFFPVEENAKYRFQCRWRSNGPKVKVFVKCYADVGTTYRSRPRRPSSGGSPGDSPDNSPGERDSLAPPVSQTREVYRSQQNLTGPKNTWNTQTEDFTPKHTKYTPRWGRVMLYAYLGGGVVEFDDVIVKQIVPSSPGETPKDPRPSMESDVTDRQIEENERRSPLRK